MGRAVKLHGRTFRSNGLLQEQKQVWVVQQADPDMGGARPSPGYPNSCSKMQLFKIRIDKSVDNQVHVKVLSLHCTCIV